MSSGLPGPNGAAKQANLALNNTKPKSAYWRQDGALEGNWDVGSNDYSECGSSRPQSALFGAQDRQEFGAGP